LLRDREENIRKMQREMSELQTRYESGLNETRRSFQHEIQDLNKRSSSLEIELADEKSHRRRLEQQKLIDEKNEIAEVVELRSDVSRINREKDLLHEKLRNAENNIQEERRNNILNKREYEDMKRTLTLVNKELQELKEKSIKEKAEKEDLIFAMQKEMANRAMSIEKLYKNNAEQTQKKYEFNLAKANKRADSYKEKALEAHKKLKEIVQR